MPALARLLADGTATRASFIPLCDVGRQTRAVLRVSARLWLLVICILIAWCLLMFRPESTSIHQGTYVSVVLAFTAATLALWSIAPWLAKMLGAMQIALNVVLYAIYMHDPASIATPRPVPSELVLFAAALGGLIRLLLLRSHARPAILGTRTEIRDTST